MAAGLLSGWVAMANAACEPARASSQNAGAPSREQIMARLQQHYDCTRSFRASFSEELSSPGGMTRTRTGIVYFKKVGRMRWQFGAPTPETIVSDGKLVYDYEPDLNQVVEVPVSKALKTNATAFLLGLGNLKRDFNAALPAKPPTDGLTHVLLTPKDGGDAMELALDPQSYDIVNFTLTDQIGNVTKLKFSDIQTNLALEDSLFRFTVPADADVVTPGQQ
jgi:outer membrane lipoprotein carrier protein